MLAIFGLKENDEKYKVHTIHFKPEVLSSDEMKSAFLIPSVPQAEIIEGKIPTLYYNPKNAKVWYEYFDAPITQESEMQREIAKRDAKIEQIQKESSDTTKALLDLYEMIIGGI